MYKYYLISDNIFFKLQVHMKERDIYLPIVGIVVTISPNFNLYRIVVLPAASRPTIKILISFLPKRPLNNVANIFPMIGTCMSGPEHMHIYIYIHIYTHTYVHICIHTYIINYIL